MKKLLLCATALGGLVLAGAASAASLPATTAPGASKATPVTFWRDRCDDRASGFYGGFYDSGYRRPYYGGYGSGFYDDGYYDNGFYANGFGGFYDAPFVSRRAHRRHFNRHRHRSGVGSGVGVGF